MRLCLTIEIMLCGLQKINYSLGYVSHYIFIYHFTRSYLLKNKCIRILLLMKWFFCPASFAIFIWAWESACAVQAEKEITGEAICDDNFKLQRP